MEQLDRRADGGRVRLEDFAQVVGAVGERKYTMGTVETALNMVRRFSTDHRADLLEAFRRVVVGVLLGDGDGHLKNWSFRFPGPSEVRLSPAYDIVPTVLYAPGDRLALRFAGTHDFARVDGGRIRRVAAFRGLDPRYVGREVRRTVERTLDLWPAALPGLLDEARAARLMARLPGLALVREAS